MRIAITGPESSGKSTLALNLSEHYKMALVPEFSRLYLDQLERPYIEEDLLIIAKGQQSSWDHFSEDESFISDSEMVILKIWSEVKYQKCDAYIVQALKQQKFDIYLLCYPDILWKADDLREHPSESDRLKLFTLYKETLDDLGFAYYIIAGVGGARLKSAIEAIDKGE